ncbi:MAG: DUF3365 domain-containing protein [Nitrospirae bacterium]|nr:DUF3365 domain-containing protein [Nitrospirota bacterium]
MKKIAIFLAAAALFSGIAFAGEKEEAIAVAVADYLLSARDVLSNNQILINDASKGDKGFTPDVYEKQVQVRFLAAAGIDVKSLTGKENEELHKAIYKIHAAAKEVIAEAQAQINEKGKGFKWFNPAVFGRRVGEKLQASGITVKQTSLKYRNDKNKPDEFESGMLKKFEAGKKDAHFEEAVVNGTKMARYILPVHVYKGCLSCHGDPIGEKDISGYAKEGYKEGQIRGAISVMVPIKQ